MTSSLEARFYLLLLLMTIPKGNCDRIPMKDMLNELFVKRGYDTRIRPGIDNGVTTNITINYKIIKILNINDVDMDFEVIMYFRHKWTDSRLVHGYGEPVILEPGSIKQVWQPDLTFVDGKREENLKKDNYNVLIWIYEDGTVFKSVRLTLLLACEMNLERYPMDTQTCYIRVESYGHTARDILLHWSDDEGKLDVSDINVPKFDLVEARIMEDQHRFISSLGSFYQHTTEITFKRKFFVQFINIYIPSMLIVGMSWVNFWVEPKVMTPRISVGLLTVLTMTTLTSSQLNDLPIVSYIRAVDVWIFSCLLFVICAFLETVLILVLLGKEQADIPAERQNHVGNKDSQADRKEGLSIATFGMSLYDLLDPTAKRKPLRRTAIHKENGGQVPVDTTRLVDRVCRVLFPGMFLGFCICYFINYIVY